VNTVGTVASPWDYTQQTAAPNTAAQELNS
jgi:hypothetical protein